MRWEVGLRWRYSCCAAGLQGLIDNAAMTLQEQPRNPLHGLTLDRILTDLVDYYGWRELGRRVPVRCFNLDPSVASSLKFLRKTPWAREKVEELYVQTLRQHQRAQR